MDCKPAEISVVSPVYRTGSFLEELTERVEEALKPLNLHYEMVFVNDACPEGSGHVLRRIAETRPRLGVVYLHRNCGQHRAILFGLTFTSGRYVVVLDSDLQDPPELIPSLYARAVMPDSPDAVLVTRAGRYESYGRLLTSRILKGLLKVFLGTPIDAGSYCLLSRRMVSCLLSMRVREPYLLAMIGATGLTIATLRAPRHTRPGGTSGFGAVGRVKLGLAALEIAGRSKLGYWSKSSTIEELGKVPLTYYGTLSRILHSS